MMAEREKKEAQSQPLSQEAKEIRAFLRLVGILIGVAVAVFFFWRVPGYCKQIALACLHLLKGSSPTVPHAIWVCPPESYGPWTYSVYAKLFEAIPALSAMRHDQILRYSARTLLASNMLGLLEAAAGTALGAVPAYLLISSKKTRKWALVCSCALALAWSLSIAVLPFDYPPIVGCDAFTYELLGNEVQAIRYYDNSAWRVWTIDQRWPVSFEPVGDASEIRRLLVPSAESRWGGMFEHLSEAENPVQWRRFAYVRDFIAGQVDFSKARWEVRVTSRWSLVVCMRYGELPSAPPWKQLYELPPEPETKPR